MSHIYLSEKDISTALKEGVITQNEALVLMKRVQEQKDLHNKNIKKRKGASY